MLPHHGFSQDLFHLPESSDLGIRHLAAVFRHTTNSYKYYWFLAMLEAIKNGMQDPSLQLLSAEMLAQVWYPVHMFRLHFGAQDQLSQLAFHLCEKSDLNALSSREEVRDQALTLALRDAAFDRALKKLQRFVPQRFLTPWFAENLRALPDHHKDHKIQTLAEEHFLSVNPPLYRFKAHAHYSGIELHPDWMTYLYNHFSIVRGFVLWSLVEYLYQRNPNVPNLPEKLFPPQQRHLTTAQRYWKPVVAQQNLQCLYSQQAVNVKDMSLDHFLPWSFVCHDQLWNLVPIPKAVNSAKSDHLPNFERYLSKFLSLQYQAIHYCLGQNKLPKGIFEDYTNLLHCELNDLKQMPEAHFGQALKDVLLPLEQIAANMGFVRGWVYQVKA